MLATSILTFLLFSLRPIHLSITLSFISGDILTNEKFSNISISPIDVGLTLAVSFINSTRLFGFIPSLLPTDKNKRISSFLGLSKEFVL